MELQATENGTCISEEEEGKEMTDKKQYRLKQPVTFLYDAEEKNEVVLRTASHGLLFMSPERFMEDFEEVNDE